MSAPLNILTNAHIVLQTLVEKGGEAYIYTYRPSQEQFENVVKAVSPPPSIPASQTQLNYLISFRYSESELYSSDMRMNGQSGFSSNVSLARWEPSLSTTT